MTNLNKAFLISTFLLASNIYADSIKLYALLLSMDYVETARDGSFLDSETNDYRDIAGLELEYSLDFADGHGGADRSSLEFNFSYLRGESKYNGFLQSGVVIVSSFQSTTNIKIFEPRLRWRETKKGDSYDVSIFTSLGYRYWLRDLGSQYGYKEEYKWGYGDIGMNFTFHENDWHVGIEGAYQRAFKPTMYAALNGGLDFDLGTTSGYSFHVPLRYDINKNTSLELAYEYDSWNISASNTVSGYYEPDSETKNETIKLGLIIKW
ncbi:hypothetical protein [Sulfurimonas sp.]